MLVFGGVLPTKFGSQIPNFEETSQSPTTVAHAIDRPGRFEIIAPVKNEDTLPPIIFGSERVSPDRMVTFQIPFKCKKNMLR